MQDCDTCGKGVDGTQHIGGSGEWGASYYVCDECLERKQEIENLKRDKMLREAIEAERMSD